MSGDPWRKVEVGLTFCIFVSYVVLGFISYFQYDAARKAARRALQANRIARDAVAESNKAFLYVSDVKINPQPQQVPQDKISTANAEIEIDVLNSGNTPARNVLTVANEIVTPGKLPSNFDYPDFIASPTRTSTFIAPKQVIAYRLPISFLTSMSVREGLSSLNVYGRIEYTDDISHTRHRTLFCVSYAAYPGRGDVFAQCNERNCADEDCAKQWTYPPRISAPINVQIPVVIPKPNSTATPQTSKHRAVSSGVRFSQ